MAFFTVHYDLYPLFLSDLEVLFFMYHLLFRCPSTDTACLSYKPRKYETCILIKRYRQFFFNSVLLVDCENFDFLELSKARPVLFCGPGLGVSQPPYW